MSGASEAPHIAAQWAEKAEHDFRNAEHTLAMFGRLRVACCRRASSPSFLVQIGGPDSAQLNR